MSSNYRKKYERHYGVEIPPDYDIHHKDGNRKHNKVKNLTAVPRVLHNLYHHFIDVVASMKIRDARNRKRAALYIAQIEKLEEEMQRLALENNCTKTG